MTAPSDLVAILLATRIQRPECPSLAEWLPNWRSGQTLHAAGGSFTAAVACALQADRLAWAFFSGYQGAIQAAFETSAGTLGAFAANEVQRKITEVETTLHQQDGQMVVKGSKSWVLARTEDLTLFVLARRDGGPATGPGSLCIVRLWARSLGVDFGDARAQAVVPEMPHSAIRLQSVVEPSDALAGDGYADYAKPFRLREDVFVTACTLAYLLSESHTGSWPTAWSQRAVAAVTLLEACSRRDPRQVETILLTAGALSVAGDLIREAEQLWAPQQQSARERWLRDKAILALGKDARRRRTLHSWRALGRMDGDEPDGPRAYE